LAPLYSGDASGRPFWSELRVCRPLSPYTAIRNVPDSGGAGSLAAFWRGEERATDDMRATNGSDVMRVTEQRSGTTALADYRTLHDEYRLEVPEHFNFGYDVVDRWASKEPEAAALWWVGPGGQERRLTFADLEERTRRLANALRTEGMEPGSRVTVHLPSVPEWWETMVALVKADLVAIPTTTQLTEKDVLFRIDAADVSGIVTNEAGAAKIEAMGAAASGVRVRYCCSDRSPRGWTSYEGAIRSAPEELERIHTRSADPSLVYFTSGTTGPPKMVLHTHASYGIGHTITADFWLEHLRPGVVHWNMSDPGWAKTAYAGYFGPWIRGATTFVVHRPGKFDARATLDTLERHPVESLCAPPTVYRMLVQEKLASFRPAALRECRAAGEALNPEVLEKWRQATGITIREGYGQSETVFLCGGLAGMPVRPGSMGLPAPGFDLAVIDGEGRRLPPGEVGEIAVRVSPTKPVGLFDGYWGAPEATARCFRDGWYRTGDCARVDEDGYVWFEARADDIITSSAYRIGPFEVESALMEHPGVAEVAVVGKPDPERTEIVKAFVVLAPGYAPSDGLKLELQEHVKRSTAPYKYPREIEFLAELPKTVTGKIRRVELRERGR
jgi:acyl-coenzyme A synthetase/AMP-(fatty) acid ligase